MESSKLEADPSDVMEQVEALSFGSTVVKDMAQTVVDTGRKRCDAAGARK